METTVNERIMLLKKQLNLTDIEFSVKSGISTGTLFRIKNGEEVSSKILISISNGTQTNIHWLETGKGKITMAPVETKVINPWQDEAYEAVKSENSTLKQEVERLWTLVLNFSQKGTNPNFLKALDVAKVPLYLLNKRTYSGANAAC